MMIDSKNKWWKIIKNTHRPYLEYLNREWEWKTDFILIY